MSKEKHPNWTADQKKFYNLLNNFACEFTNEFLEGWEALDDVLYAVYCELEDEFDELPECDYDDPDDPGVESHDRLQIQHNLMTALRSMKYALGRGFDGKR